MANKTRSLLKNVPGRFFVDDTCINADNCRELAPEVFGEADLRAFVAKQPDGADEEDRATLALLQCPRGAIGSHTSGHIDQERLNQRYPEAIEDGVFLLGHNSPRAFGSKSYLILHPDGNWMVDGPKFHPTLVKAIEAHGGLSHIFLTHRDDVGDADKLAKHFGARRIIHELDRCTQPDAEIILTSFDPTSFGEDFVVIGTPGHTEGHCMLLHRGKFLFSGDTLTSRVRFGDPIEAWSPMYCWYDWDTLVESLRRLAAYDFEWLLPGHGRRTHLPRGTSRDALAQALARANQETDKDPTAQHRLEIFEAVSRFVTEPDQKARYAAKAAKNRAALAQLGRDPRPSDAQ